MTLDLAICFLDLIRSRNVIQSAMKLVRLSRETVFSYKETVITATRSDGIACLPSDQANGRPAVVSTVSPHLLVVQNSLTSNTKYRKSVILFRPPLWSSSWLQIRRPGFDSRHYQKTNSSGSEAGSTQPREYN
jgi:hypothetical protein